MASYPATPVVFPARSDGATIFAAHVNALQDEVAAVEAALLGGLAHDLKGLQSLTLPGFLTPPTLTADTNDYAPAGLPTAYTVRLTSDAARNVSGMLAQPLGRIVVLLNAGSNPITFLHASALSAAVNRFLIFAGGTRTLQPGDSITVQYDPANFWRVIGDAQSAASAALEGNWTPTVTGSGGGASTLTGQVGLYTKIGRRVTIDCVVPITTVGALVGSIQIGGLPFPSNASITSIMPVYFLGMASAMSQLQVALSPSTSVLVLQKIPAAGAVSFVAAAVADLTTTTVLRITGSYIAST